MKVDIDNLTPVSKFRNETASILLRIKEAHSPVILTQRGHPSFVLEEIETYRKKAERLEVLEDIFASLKEIGYCQKYLPKILLTVNIFRQLCKFELPPLFSRFLKRFFL